jgi:hypothetical protein
MSAFIVRGQVIGDVVQMIDYMDRKALQAGGARPTIGGEGELPPLHSAERHGALVTLGDRLLSMNCHAVAERYGEDPADVWRGSEKPEGLRIGHLKAHSATDWPETDTIAQWIKSTDCLLYQCCEGNVPEEWVLFDEVQQVKLRACEAWVKSGAEYEDAEWNRG